jgi:hypothetical protein
MLAVPPMRPLPWDFFLFGRMDVHAHCADHQRHRLMTRRRMTPSEDRQQKESSQEAVQCLSPPPAQ